MRARPLTRGIRGPAAGLIALVVGLLAVAPAQASVVQPGTVIGGDRLAARGAQTELSPGVPLPPVPKAAAWLVADLDSREVLAARNAHLPLAPASTMKIFTALALMPRLDPATVYTARPADAAVDGTKVGLSPGSRYTVDDLLHGLLMGSGNDCAHALGTLAGGQRAATRLMKGTADRLGAFDTVPVTTSGLDAPGQVTSAYDLALAGAAALQDPQLAAVMTTRDYRFPGLGTSFGPKRERFATQNHNRLLGNVLGATGVKNGYTVAARGSFVGSATRGGHSYLAVVLRAEGSTWRATGDLLDWAFRYGPRSGAVGSLVQPGSVVLGTGDDATALDGAAPDGSGAARPAVAEGGTMSQLRSTLDGAGLDSQMVLLTGAAALTAGLLAGTVRLQLARRRRARLRRAADRQARMARARRSLDARSGYPW